MSKKDKALSVLQRLSLYPNLFNPVDSFFSAFSPSGERKSKAPQGNLRLSKNDTINHALWNTIYSSALLGSGALLVSYLINKYHENKTRKAMKSGVTDRLEAVRPTLVADPNLEDISTYTSLPEKDQDRVQELLNKEAAGAVGDIAEKTTATVLPITAAALAIAGGIWGGNEIVKKKLKEKLKKERIDIRNAQAYIDRKILQEQGLILPDEKETEKLDKKAGLEDILTGAASIPTSIWALSGLGLGGIVYALSANRDKNLATVKQLNKMQFGKNELQTAPAISILDLPAKPEEMLRLPGDKKVDTYSDKEEDKKEEKKEKTKALTNSDRKKLAEIIDVVPIDSADIVRAVKKDALFR